MPWQRQFKFRKNNYIAGHIFAVLLASVAPLLFGLPIIIWQAERSLQRQAEHASQAIVLRINAILDNSKKATQAAVPLIDKSCPEIVDRLRLEATIVPFVRSLFVVNKGMITCSTVYGNANLPLDIEHFNDNMLALLSGNSVTPERAVVVYQIAHGSSSIVASIDGLHVIQLLNGAETTPTTMLIIGAYWMGRDGKVHNTPLAPPSRVSAAASSNIYPFSVNSGFEAGALQNYIRVHYLPLLTLLVALGGFTGLTVHRLARSARNVSAEVRRAIRNHEFVPYYQAVVDSKTKEWTGVEVLVRWQHPMEGLIPPDNFIPFMERSGLIVPMTSNLMVRVAEELTNLGTLLPDGFHVGINVSSAHLTDRHLFTQCQNFIAKFPARKIKLVLELTEREAIEPTEELQHLLKDLRQIGVHIALDDFGVGHSNLNYLKEFHADLLKIDRSFVVGISNNDLSQHVLQSIIDLAERLELRTVAEGVETQAQADYLLSKGIHYLQGYLFSRPAPISVFAPLLQKHKADFQEEASNP